MNSTGTGYAPGEHPDLPAPQGRLRRLLFPNLLQGIGSLLAIGFVIWVLSLVVGWLLPADSTAACRYGGAGACWNFLQMNGLTRTFLTGFAPPENQWRYWLCLVLALPAMVPLLASRPPFQPVFSLVTYAFPFLFFLLAIGPLNFPGFRLLGNNDELVFGLPLILLFKLGTAALWITGLRKNLEALVVLARGAFLALFALLLISKAIWIDLPQLMGQQSWLPTLEFKTGGLVLTLLVTVEATGLALVAGLLLAWMKLSGMPVLRLLSDIHVQLFRSIPVIVLLLGYSIVFNYLTSPGVVIDLHTRMIIGFALLLSVYMRDPLCAGWLNATAEGFAQRLCYTIRHASPRITAGARAVMLTSCVMMIMGFPDMLGISKMLMVRNLATRSFLEIYAVTTVMYLVPALLLIALERHLERRRIRDWGMPPTRPPKMEME